MAGGGRSVPVWPVAQNECSACTVQIAIHAIASGISDQAVIAATRRMPGRRRLSTSRTTAATTRIHCPMPPAIHHALKEAHGAQELLTQLKSSVQVDPTPKPTAHQPAVASAKRLRQGHRPG